MKKLLIISAAVSSLCLSGCASVEAFGSDSEIVSAANQSCSQYDAQSKVTSRYDSRMAIIRQGLPNSVGGQALNYKVYETSEMNAWAMPNGCVRVYSGLMDKLSNDEVRAVLGHEIGHVALRHSVKQYRNNTGVQLGAAAVGAIGSAFGATILADQTLQNVALSTINAQYSQKLETEADDYSVDLMLKEKNGKQKALAMATALKKVTSSGGSSTLMEKWFGDHPDPQARIKNVEDRVAAATSK